MQKGIGAAPFAIVAALIIALAVGFWATQPAQAAEGDVLLTVQDVDTGTFVDPGGAADTSAFGAGNAESRTGLPGSTALEVGYADADADNVFRGELISADHWVEFQAGISDASDAVTANALGFLITVSGEASLSKSSTLTSASCTPQDDLNSAGVCQFPVYGTGSAGDFSVTAAAAAGTALTVGGDGDPATKNGQWVGPATSGTAITEDPDGGATIAGTLSPPLFLSGATAGLANAGEVGFLFQLTDAGGRVAMNTDSTPTGVRDDLRVTAVADAGEDVDIAAGLSVATGGGTVYVDIQQERTLSSAVNYPASGNSLGGLVAVGLSSDLGEGTVGRIVIDLGGGNSIEHPFAIAGDPDADMSSVGAAASPVNLGSGHVHERAVTLRDANGTLVSLAAGGSATVIVPDVTGDDDQITVVVGDAAADNAGVYPLTITANGDAENGNHAFTVLIRDLADSKDVVEKSADADGNPLEAHVGTDIDALSIASVTNVAGDDILDAGDEVSVGAFELITITLAATGEDGLPPINGSSITLLSGTGFAGSGSLTRTTDDAGEATATYRAGTTSQALAFSANGASASLLVRIAGDDEPAAATVSLVSGAGSTFVSWQGGDASSSEFENVAGLVVVWKWTGSTWVSYVSDPAVPASLKTDFALSDGDVLFVVSDGAVDITLG